METFWRNNWSLNFEITKVGEVYEKYKFTDASFDTIMKIRQATGNGIMDSKKLLQLYLERIGKTINENNQIVEG